MTIVLFWIMFLQKDLSILKNILSTDFTSVFSILTDILICISIFSWFLSIRSGKIPAFMRIIAFGLVLFAFTDIFYYYIDFTGLYIPNRINDFIYITSLYIIAIGALNKTYYHSSIYNISVNTNTGGRLRWIYLVIYPLIAIFFSVTGLINIKLNTLDIITFAAPILAYWGSCEYVQISIKKEALLKRVQ